MNRYAPILAVVAILLTIIAYRFCTPGSQLNVEPHAVEEIEKAKQR